MPVQACSRAGPSNGWTIIYEGNLGPPPRSGRRLKGPKTLVVARYHRQNRRMGVEPDPAEPKPTDDSLSARECWELLRDQAFGRIAVVGDDGPEIFPVNVLVDHGTLVFRTGSGTKLDAIRIEPRVAFEVDGFDAGRAWSVIIRGTARVVTDTYEAIDVVEIGVTPWQAGPKPEFVRIEPTTITGRRFQRAAPESWSVPTDHRTTSVD